jgi:hypothetical protein
VGIEKVAWIFSRCTCCLTSVVPALTFPRCLQNLIDAADAQEPNGNSHNDGNDDCCDNSSCHLVISCYIYNWEGKRWEFKGRVKFCRFSGRSGMDSYPHALKSNRQPMDLTCVLLPVLLPCRSLGVNMLMIGVYA